jgi:hypothetical protein
MAIRESWQPIEVSFRPETEGCLQIVVYATEHGLKPERMQEYFT